MGASFRTVASVMHTGTALPIIHEQMIMRDAIMEMTVKELGIFGVVDGRVNSSVRSPMVIFDVTLQM